MKGYERQRRGLKSAAFLAALCLALTCASACADQANGELTIRVIDCNAAIAPFRGAIYHGDSTLIAFPDGTTMLVDTQTKTGASAVLACLREQGVERIDYLVISHAHADHTGGVKAILREFQVGRVVCPAYGGDNIDADMDFYMALRKKGLEPQTPARGDIWNVGGATIEFFSPPRDPQRYDAACKTRDQYGDEINELSLVFRLAYGEFSMLFTGDIQANMENELVGQYGDALRSDVLKVAHHGNATSSTDAFLDAVSPNIAVAMASGLHLSVQRAFTWRAVPVYATCTDGDIVLRTDGRKCAVICLKGESAVALGAADAE